MWRCINYSFVGAGHARDIAAKIAGLVGIARGRGPLLHSFSEMKKTEFFLPRFIYRPYRQRK